MTANPDRIAKMRHVTAMVAWDTMPHLAARITRLLSHGRRIAMTRRYTYTNEPPGLYAGLTLDPEGHGGGIRYTDQPQWRGLGVSLRPGLRGFGIGANAGEEDTEAEVWARYHKLKAESDDPFQRRTDMTRIDVTGGLDGDGPSRDDLIVIRAWNRDGVCEEYVIAFDDGRER